MLDSLVRVSRRVGWATDRQPLTLSATRGHPVRARTPTTSTASSPRRRTPGRAEARRRGVDPRSADRPATAAYNTDSANCRSPGDGARGGRRSGRGALPREVHAPRPVRRTPGPRGSGTHGGQRGDTLNPRGSDSRPHPFASKRFHVLLNSLFKVLFNFPSRYLSAIGLVSVFSLRWSLPPALGCIPKQPDSGESR